MWKLCYQAGDNDLNEFEKLDSICIVKRGYAGFNGAINLIEDLTNSIMTGNFRREGLYDNNFYRDRRNFHYENGFDHKES